MEDRELRVTILDDLARLTERGDIHWRRVELYSGGPCRYVAFWGGLALSLEWPPNRPRILVVVSESAAVSFTDELLERLWTVATTHLSAPHSAPSDGLAHLLEVARHLAEILGH